MDTFFEPFLELGIYGKIRERLKEERSFAVRAVWTLRRLG